jgi:tetratricopeptide (TPR) repeat protein
MIRSALVALLLISTPALAQNAKEDTGEVATARKLSSTELRADTLDKLFYRLRKSEQPEEAKKAETQIWQLWMESDSPTAEALLQQATIAMGDQAPGPALKILDALIDAHPDMAEAWNKRATLYFNLGRFDDSIADIEKTLELEPRHFGALSGWGMILRIQGKDLEALKVYKEALSVNPQMPGVQAAVKEIEEKSRGI